MFHLADLGDVGVTGDEAVEERDERERESGACQIVRRGQAGRSR